MFADLQIDQIAANPGQPRKFFDEDKHKELKGSIEENGLLQPVVVRPVEDGDTPYMLIAGERRWRACKAAGLTVIPANVLEDTDDEKAYVLGIAENVGRADMTIMEEAGAYADLKSAGWEPLKIAKQFGKTETAIKWRLGLLTLRKEVAEMVDRGEIKNNLAWHIAQLNPGNQMVAASRYVRGDFDSEAEAQHFANALKMMEQQTTLTSEKAPSAEETEKRKKAKAQAKDGLGKAEEVLLPLLEELAKQKPEDLAVILGDDLTRHVRVVGKLHSQVQMVRNLLSKAQGIQRAMAADFNKKAIEVQQEQAEQGEAKPEAKPVAKKATSDAAAVKPSEAAAARTRTAPPARKAPVRKAPARKPTAKSGTEAAAKTATKAEATATK
ncbi:ParB/RepB/Spo0J family partition protein [Streptomyces lunaelactis]|uniref:ParB/RepB/Spo0J family partition protein n=1 Tax=Streptomyces lunaelactis TaxID=1535768 RepID=UPI0015859598|nr:ParB/RepB/Spo0J family partition protein [Streptomyces lunaelactis]NUK32321.1 ParB/RepB/Spo0J family partition protein [Streptomyces lunaelactis]NUK40351.1 ParB/RepB/Spo0J family partition protein [Streptomyces lunaelactis]